MKLGEESNYEPAEKVTYEKIKEYVKTHYGMNVSSLYIAQVKGACGLDKRENHNLSQKENARVPQCPVEKQAAIMEAFRYFGLI